jgi:predicted dehydrogenase
VIYTVQGDRGAITVDDDDMQISVQQATDGPDVAQGAVRWLTETRKVGSDWMDASHVEWFNSLFDGFRTAIDRRDYAGRDAQEAFRCVQLIDAAYRSAASNCQDMPLKGLPPGISSF